MRDDKVGIVRLPVEGDHRHHHAGEATEREDEQEAENEERRCRELQTAEAIAAIQANTWIPLGMATAIRVSCPPALVCFAIGRMVARYMAANPRVAIELDSTSRRVDVIGEGIDVAIRVRFPPLQESDLIARVLGASPQRLVATPELIAALQPLGPPDLAGLPSLSLGPLHREHVWQLDGPDGAHVRIPHKPRLVTDDMAQLLYAALEGVGVVQLPTIVADAHIASGALVDLLPEWRAASGMVQAVFPSRRGLLPSVRTFIDFLATEYAALPASTTRPANG